MTFRSRAGWLLVHAAPFIVIPLLAWAAARLNEGVVGVLCFTVLLVMVVAGQAQTVVPSRWHSSRPSAS